MKILITGAHFTPAVAVIDQLKKIPDVSITYVGRNTTREGDNTQSIESHILPKMGVEFIPIIAGRVQRHFSIFTIISLLKLPIGFIQAFFIVLTQKPNVILSFGGYVGVPVVFAGWLWSVPIIIHEQTLVSGLANKFSSLFADKICVSFDQNHLANNSKIVLTGNPIRKEVLEAKGQIPEDMKDLFKESKTNELPIIFVTGGNQGSHLINVSVEQVLDKLTKIACVIHQTGDSKHHDFERLADKQSNRYLVKKWIGEEIGEVFEHADLLVSRAGANTLSESAFWGIPTLAIPLPYLYQNEQVKNAKFFESKGLVTILYQSHLSGDNLYEEIKRMFKNLDQLKLQADGAKNLSVQDAAQRIAVETLQLASNNS